MRVSEIRVNQIRVNQGLGVSSLLIFSHKLRKSYFSELNFTVETYALQNYIKPLRLITTFVLSTQQVLRCQTDRIPNEGWLVLIGTPSVDILNQSDCASPCCLLSQ